MAKTNKDLSFESAIEKMEAIVEKLENGEVELEESIALYREGMEFSKLCHDKLEKIEKEIYTLTEKNGEFVERKVDLKEE